MPAVTTSLFTPATSLLDSNTVTDCLAVYRSVCVCVFVLRSSAGVRRQTEQTEAREPVTSQTQSSHRSGPHCCSLFYNQMDQIIQVSCSIKNHTADKMHETSLIKLSTLVPSHNGELDMHILPHNGPLLLITLIQLNQPYRRGGSHKAHSEKRRSETNKKKKEKEAA